MRRVFVIIILALSVSISCKGDRKEEVKPNKKVTLYSDLNGVPVGLEQFKGKRILVNYWATWCVPCLKEFPSLVKAQEILLNDNYVFLFPSPDGVEKIKAFYQASSYPLQFLSLNVSLDKLDIYALPSTNIYATDGSVYKKIEGATDWSAPEMIQLLRDVP